MYLSENVPQGNQELFRSHSSRPRESDLVDSSVASHPVTAAADAAPKAKTEFLSAADERSHVWRWQKRKDRRKRDVLVRAFLPAITKVARKYRSRGLDLDDRIQLGIIGFLIALDKFDIRRGLRLWTYAKEWVRAEISAATEKSQSLVVRPRTPGKAKRGPGDFSLNTPAQEGGAEYIDGLLDDYPDHEPRHYNEQALTNALESLKPRERAIFTARRLSVEPETLSTLAVRFQISSERVRQIEVDAVAIVSARMKEAEARPNPQFARQLTAATFRGRGHKLSYSYHRWSDFRDRSPALNREGQL